MAKETNLSYWLGTDHAFPFHVKNLAETASIDITGMTLSFMVKSSLDDADSAARLTIPAVISGIFNSVPATNTQRATVTILDSNTDDATVWSAETDYYELKRMDAGLETVIAYGLFILLRGVQRG